MMESTSPTQDKTLNSQQRKHTGSWACINWQPLGPLQTLSLGPSSPQDPILEFSVDRQNWEKSYDSPVSRMTNTVNGH